MSFIDDNWGAILDRYDEMQVSDETTWEIAYENGDIRIVERPFSLVAAISEFDPDVESVEPQ